MSVSDIYERQPKSAARSTARKRQTPLPGGSRAARRRRICRRRLPQCEDFTVPSPDSRVSFKAARHLQVAFSAAAEESQRGVFGRVRVSSPVDVWWRLRAGGAGLGAVAMAGCAIVSMVLSKSNP